MNNNFDELKENEKRGGMWNSNTFVAIIFIIVGAGLIMSNITGFAFKNWWALFMLVPVSMFAQNIYRDYQANGRITSRSTGSIIVVISILAGAAVFLFEAVTWGMIWPIGLIIAGLSMYLGSRS